MGDNMDVKALMARFSERVEPEGCAPTRAQASSPTSEWSTNGVVRNKISPAFPKSALQVNTPTKPKRPGQAPHGVFPKPPPSHRTGSKDIKAPFPNSENIGRVKLKGELLQNQILKHHDERKPQMSTRSILPSQRSLSEVPPLRKPLPPLGPRPLKPKRPPNIHLNHLQKKALVPLPRRSPEKKASDGPVRPPNKPTMLSQSFSKLNVEPDQDTYDDIDLPPPPPPPKPSKRESWTGSFSSQVDEESDGEIYEHIEDQHVPAQASVSENKQKELKRQQELEKKAQKERLKRENEYRKKFKLQMTGEVEVLHTARARTDWYGGKHDLSVKQGDSVEIIRIKDNPEGKWLARNMNGEYGYISNTCVDVDYEEVKRRLRTEAAPSNYPAPVQDDKDIYDDVLNSSLNLSNDVYDDVDEFPLPPPEICYDPKRSKKLEKEEKEFRKKFKFEGPINVLFCMMVDPNANIKKSGGKDLSVVRGEILDVIEQTNEKKLLCRNEQGKYGYVPRSYLLQPENEVYDDIDSMKDIYDNDASLTGPLRP